MERLEIYDYIEAFEAMGYIIRTNRDEDDDDDYNDSFYYTLVFIKDEIGYVYEHSNIALDIITEKSPRCDFIDMKPLDIIKKNLVMEISDYVFNNEDELGKISVIDFLAPAKSFIRKQKIKKVLNRIK